MTRRAFVIGLISIFVLSLAIPAHCDTPIKKLGRGICNVVTSPFEILLQVQRTNESDGPMAGMTYGLLKGLAMTGVRALIGAFEVVTFPIPVPKEFKPILKDPEFFFEDMIW